MNNSKEINTRRWWRFAIWGVMLGWLVMSSAPVQAQTNTTVYVVSNGGQFGYFDLTTRAYTEISGNAFVGIQTTGLAYRSTTGTMYLTHGTAEQPPCTRLTQRPEFQRSWQPITTAGQHRTRSASPSIALAICLIIIMAMTQFSP